MYVCVYIYIYIYIYSLGSQLRVLAPAEFTLQPAAACAPMESATALGLSSLPAAFLQRAREAWPGLRPAGRYLDKTVLPMPPSVACSVAQLDGRWIAQLMIPDRLRGGQPFVMVVNALAPSRTPPPGNNRWGLQVWREINFVFRLAFDIAVDGFLLVPKLQQELIQPTRSQNNAFLKQSRLLPVEASYISINARFALPFEESQLRPLWRVAIVAPDRLLLLIAPIINSYYY